MRQASIASRIHDQVWTMRENLSDLSSTCLRLHWHLCLTGHQGRSASRRRFSKVLAPAQRIGISKLPRLIVQPQPHRPDELTGSGGTLQRPRIPGALTLASEQTSPYTLFEGHSDSVPRRSKAAAFREFEKRRSVVAASTDPTLRPGVALLGPQHVTQNAGMVLRQTKDRQKTKSTDETAQ